MGWKNIERRIITRTNAERQKRGLRPLRVDAKLHRAAKRHSKYMMRKKYLGHSGPNGDTPERRAESENYGGHMTDHKGRRHYAIFWDGDIGENVVHYPHESSRSDDWTGWLIFDIWMKNQRDWDNILSEGYKDVAVAVVRRLPKGKTYYVTQVFGTGERFD